MAKIYIDHSTFIECISELAESAIHREIHEKSWIQSDNAGGTEYTEEGTVLFNETYDTIEEIINRTLKVHSNSEQW